MMCEEPQHKELEPTEYKLAIKEIERKADDMFLDLDADGDGFLTEVKSFIHFINYHVSIVQEEFINGCMQNEDLVKHITSTN